MVGVGSCDDGVRLWQVETREREELGEVWFGLVCTIGLAASALRQQLSSSLGLVPSLLGQLAVP